MVWGEESWQEKRRAKERSHAKKQELPFSPCFGPNTCAYVFIIAVTTSSSLSLINYPLTISTFFDLFSCQINK